MTHKYRSYGRRFRELRKELNRINLVSNDVDATGQFDSASTGGNNSAYDRHQASKIARNQFPHLSGPIDLILTPNEINLQHGTGVLLNRIFAVDECHNFRSRDNYEDKGEFSSEVMQLEGKSRSEVFATVMDALKGLEVRRIICVPYYSEDFMIAIACKSILQVPMAVWIMDDTIVYPKCVGVSHYVDRKTVLELLNLADIRFAISAEMRDEYETQYSAKFHVLPPTVDACLLERKTVSTYSKFLEEKTCAMVGNIWGRSWLLAFMEMVRESGWKVHWFGRGSACSWLETSREELLENGVVEMGFILEEELASKLADYPFAILPTGSGGEEDDKRNVTLLSLPTRMPFMLATAKIPMLVVGSDSSCSARFVKHLNIGLASAYDHLAFKKAVEHIADADFQREFRANCEKLANEFSDEDLASWIWDSCNTGVPATDRFEVMFRRDPKRLVAYIDDPAPSDIYSGFVPVYTALNRVAKFGYQPDFVFDVGASTGCWSEVVRRLFPAARYILIDPLQGHYEGSRHELPGFEWVEAAASNENGTMAFQVSNDLYGSSLMSPNDNRSYESVDVPVVSLDHVRDEKRISGRGIIKIDVQFAEHLVIEGAQTLLEQVDFLIIELTLRRSIPQAMTFLELVNQMEEAGFTYFDDIGEWRCPVTGVLDQKDVLFINKNIASKYKPIK